MVRKVVTRWKDLLRFVAKGALDGKAKMEILFMGKREEILITGIRHSKGEEPTIEVGNVLDATILTEPMRNILGRGVLEDKRQLGMKSPTFATENKKGNVVRWTAEYLR